MKELDVLRIRQQVLFDLIEGAESQMDGEKHGVIISFKEIYDEVKKTSTEIERIGKRLENVEKKIETQEKQREEDAKRKTDYESRLKIGIILSLIPFFIMVVIYLAKEGVFG